MKLLIYFLLSFGLTGLVIAGCNGGEASDEPRGAESGGSAELSAFELEHGIGPVTERISLGEIDQQLVLRGEDAYQMKCESCHREEQRFVGPPLGDVLDRRSPEFVMNMMLNPAEMLEKHPVAQELLAEYMTPMPFQNVDREEARAIVEYLRTLND